MTATNNTPDAVRVELVIDGVLDALDVPANGQSEKRLANCPQAVTLTELRLQSPSGRVIVTELGDLADVSLALNDNYECGDAVTLVVGSDASILRTIPSGR